MTDKSPLFELKATPKNTRPQTGNNEGWERSLERKKPGPKPKGRVSQIHPRTFPEVAEEFTEMATQRRQTIGEFLEDMLEFWKEHHKKSD